MVRKPKMGYLTLLVLVLLKINYIETSENTEARKVNSRTLIDLQGGPESVIWVVQLSDLHFSVFHPERALDFQRFVGPALAMINPALVLVTGDLTDGKSEDLLTTKQYEEEWIEYHKVMENVVERSGLHKNIFYDLRGNHDKYGVPVVGGSFDFFPNYSINGQLGRSGNVHSITIQNGERKHLFVGFDSTMSIGIRGPTNIFGHPTDELVAEIDVELSQWGYQSTKGLTKISFGHFPLSLSASTESGKSLKDAFLKHSLSAYICGHLHRTFGENLKWHHQSDNHFLSPEKYFQLNIYQTPQQSTTFQNYCFDGAPRINEFWEWEMGDWRKNRVMRVLAIDAGHVSFVDTDYSMGAKEIIILPTFPLDSRFMLTASSLHEYGCSIDQSSVETVRALVFSTLPIASVVARVFDTGLGKTDMVMEATMRKHENSSRGDLYAVPWNWSAFDDPSPDRFWVQIEAIDIMERSTLSQLRPFSINSVTAKSTWSWTEFLIMGCQWDVLYFPIVWFILLFILSMLLIPKALLIHSRTQYTYINFIVQKGFIRGIIWVLTEFCRVSLLWYGILVYLFYLIFFPWFCGEIFTRGGDNGCMTYKGWIVNIPGETSRRVYMGHPDIMVVVLPHLFLVVLPAVLVMAALAAERAVYRLYFLSLSEKKEDDHTEGSRGTSYGYHDNKISKFVGIRLMRNFLMLICLVIYWIHWKLCRVLTKAYGMNPVLHSPGYCLPVPLFLAYAVYKTSRV